MRHPIQVLLLIGCLTAAVQLYGQIDQQPYLQQQNVAPPGKPQSICYENYWQQGMEARRSGDYKNALEKFIKAGECPDFPDDPQLIDDLEVLIAQSKRALERARLPMANGEVPRRRHVYSRAYLRNSDPECFDLTRREAETAFADSCWDDAANLFRAAKSCADANQHLRMEMDERIQACRIAAEDELRASEQKAVRRERHALASNLAGQARILLGASDRTIAYRLADFANEYVAPEGDDNADCLQTMYDTWYFSPHEHAKVLGNDLVDVPFCYQIKENLGKFCQVQFAGTGKETQLFVYSTTEHRFYRWETENFTPTPVVSIPDTTMKRFEAAPDAQTILFSSDTAYLLWRGPNEQVRISVPQVLAHCFSEDGSAFLYWDDKKQQVISVALDGLFGARKGNTRTMQETVLLQGPEGQVEEIKTRGDILWVGFSDRYELWSLSEKRRLRSLTLTLPPHLLYTKKYILPQAQAIVVETDTALLICQILANDDNVYGTRLMPGTPLACSDDALMSAHFMTLEEESGSNTLRVAFGFAESRSDRLDIRDLQTGNTRYTTFLQPGDLFLLQSGAFSPDKRFFAAVNDEQTLKVWQLEDASSNMISANPFGPGAINPNGQNIAFLQSRQLTLASLDKPGVMQNYPLPAGLKASRLLSINGDWVLYTSGQDSLIAFNFEQGKHLAFYAQDIFIGTCAAIDTASMTLAYAVDHNELQLRSLRDGSFLHKTPGHFTKVVPVKDGRYLVQEYLETEYERREQALIRLWEPGVDEAKLPVVRMHEFSTEQYCVSPSGKRAAFTDGNQIRIFALQNLLDEQVRLNPYKHYAVRKMLFTPDETALAVIYENYAVVFWELSTGQWRFYIVPRSNDQVPSTVVDAHISADGSTMYQMTDRYIEKHWLDPDSIRAVLNNANYPMAAFQPVQIRDLNLERALLYPGNFERLAYSDDIPLIRAFFDFYQEQALNSQNINEVREYCNRAFKLYERLDPGVQRAQRTTMTRMYSDFHWKLLLRNQTREAEEIVHLINKNFQEPKETILAEAHTHLLNHDLAPAAKGYARWISEQYAAATEDYFFNQSMKKLERDFLQLVEYDLLEKEQMACACAALKGFSALPAMCSAYPDSLVRWLAADERMTHRLLQKLYQAKSFGRLAENARFLESAYKTLQQNADVGGLAVYNQITRQLADVYVKMGQFELNMPPAEPYYRRAIELLNVKVPDVYAEKQRLEKLIRTRSLLIERQLLTGNGAGAEQDLLLNLQAYQKRLNMERDSFAFRQVQADLGLTLYEQLGMANLLLHKPDNARSAFELAQLIAPEGMNAYYFGHVALLSGNKREALKRYSSLEGILDGRMFGVVAGQMQLFGELFPNERDSIPACRQQLVDRLLHGASRENQASFDSLEMMYYEGSSNFQRTFTNDNWADAYQYAQTMLSSAEQKVSALEATDEWKNRWLDANINVAYTQLFQMPPDTARFSYVIRYSLEAERFIEKMYPEYRNGAFLKTNMAHAYWIRNQPMDRRKALDIYFDFLKNRDVFNTSADAYEFLLKDFRDLYRNGIVISGLADLVEATRPANVVLTPEEWRQMGIEPLR